MDERKSIPVPPRPNSITQSVEWVMVFNLIMGKGPEEVKKTFRVNKRRILVGSALSSDIRIQQNSVSNVHAVVEMDEKGHAHVFDMASETGVFVNGKKVLSEELKDGDELKIGFATLTFGKQAVSDAQAQLPPSAVRSSSSGQRKLFYDTQEDFRPLILEDERNVIQIFDYPAGTEQALQVVMYWGDVILDVRHLVEKKDITLGETREATFCVPGFHTPFTFISYGTDASLEFTQEMKGVLRSGRQMIALDQLPSRRITLKKDDLAKVQFRDISFYVSYSPVPPHLRRQRVLERDPLFTRIWFTSVLTTIAIILLLVSMEPKKELEMEELPPRVATIIFKPAPPPLPPPPKPKEVKPPEPPKELKPPEPPKPKPIPPKPPVRKSEPPKELPKQVKPPVTPPKTTPSEKPVTQAANQVRGEAQRPAGGNQGEGARARGEEGRKGEPGKPKSPVGMYSSRGNPNVNTPTKSEVRGQGNVEALFSDIGGSISKNLAASGAGASAAGERLRGFGAFTTEGVGGLGNVGTGRGGGGTSQNVQGLGTKGLGDGASGTGLGAIGSGGNLSGTGRGRPAVEVGNATDTVIMGGLDKSVIDEYIKRHMSQIRYCYVKELNTSQAPFTGRVLTRFVISGSGRVSQSGVESSSLGNASVERCLTDVIRKIVFPEPLGGGVVEVSYPFSFTPSAAGG
jgi:outer membrane biosynthesis protein TonB/pSer/pThr/pTyr-binding forkhead associated (FHA) protein